ncbi:MAG: DEAD/DEAH box helicase [Vampirovibrionales bacterium]|nr:DEAD/DEAH box helicase [Vampirovibrionales bacterium]
MTSLHFDALSLTPETRKAIDEMGYRQASAIQAQTIPLMRQGLDLIGQAQTGGGKTAAFAIPLIERTDPQDMYVQALTLCPTRELALQVCGEFQKLGKYRRYFFTAALYGGQPIERQLRQLRQRPPIVIGTPGRVLDLIRRGALDLSRVKTVVLDEADEMLNMGFRPDIERILAYTPETRQTVFFSATMPRPILEMSARYLKNPQHIQAQRHDEPVAEIEQSYFEVPRAGKMAVLTHLIAERPSARALIFCNTKWGVDSLVKRLKNLGIEAEGLHGGKTQPQRDRIMNSFRQGATHLLVATDVAARGLHVDNIEAVINYDLPKNTEFYVHRIGRTGRAGKSGRAFTFVEASEFQQLRQIRRYANARLVRQELPARA